jgi:hypothetical protein
MFCFKCQKEVDPVEAGDETVSIIRCKQCQSLLRYDTLHPITYSIDMAIINNCLVWQEIKDGWIRYRLSRMPETQEK